MERGFFQSAEKSLSLIERAARKAPFGPAFDAFPRLKAFLKCFAEIPASRRPGPPRRAEKQGGTGNFHPRGFSMEHSDGSERYI